KGIGLTKSTSQHKYWLQRNRIDACDVCPSVSVMKQIELKEVTELAPLLCQSCGGVMRLIGIEPHHVEAETDLLTYCCTACDTFSVLPIESGKHPKEASFSSEAPWLKLVRSHDFSEPINQTLKAQQTFPKHPVYPRCDAVKRQPAKIKATPELSERLANLLMLSHEAMLVWTLDGTIEFWNSGAETLYGFAPSEAVGHVSHDLLRTKFPMGFAELRSQLRNERDWSGELSHICKGGDEVVVESRMQLFGYDTVLEVNRDVTTIKQIEAVLRESQQRLNFLASIVESCDDAIVSKNIDGIVTSWNRGAERVFGYTAEEAIGQPITIVIPQDRHHEE